MASAARNPGRFNSASRLGGDRGRQDMKIRTHFAPPPIPFRQFDWTAIDDDSYDGAEDSKTRNQIGYGRTEQEAIADLLEQIEER